MVAAIADDWAALAYEGFPEQNWHKAAADTYGAERAAWAAAEGKTHWVETLDASALRLGTIERLFPTCQVIHLVTGGPSDPSARSVRTAPQSLSEGRSREVSVRHLWACPAVVRAVILDQVGPPHRQLVAA